MSADLQPSGWRLVVGSGRDVRRAESYLGQDLDEVAEAYDGYTGPFKVQVVGPWTLASNLWLPRGERVVSDPGAARDLVQSLASGVVEQVEHVRRLVPGADVVVQIDEPSLPFVLDGKVRKASGYGFLRPVDRSRVEESLRGFVATVADVGVRLVCHCCAPTVPVTMLARAGFHGVGLDVSLLKDTEYEPIGESIDAGLELWAGIVPTSSDTRHPAPLVERLTQVWNRIGLGRDEYDRLVVTPACGLGLAPPTDAVRIQRLAVEVAVELNERS